MILFSAVVGESQPKSLLIKGLRALQLLFPLPKMLFPLIAVGITLRAIDFDLGIHLNVPLKKLSPTTVLKNPLHHPA